MSKRIITLMLTLCMLLSVITGCSKDNTQTKTNEEGNPSPATGEQTSASIITEPGKLPIVTKPISLKIGLAPQPTVTDHKDNYLTKRLKEDTGIDLDFYFFPTSQTGQKLELMIASGEKLPDLIMGVDLDASARYNYGKGGFILPLNDYIEKYGYFFNTNSKKYMNETELSLLNSLGKSPDGNMYGFPFYNVDISDTLIEALYINHEWLKAVKMEMPKTTEELYNVLVAFRDKDPNGNGLKDEIPLVGYNSPYYRGDIIQILMNSFRYNSKYRFDVKDGIVSPQFNDESYRDGLRYINKLYKEGLISPLSFTQDQAQLKAMIDLPSNQKTIVGTVATHPLSGLCGFSTKEDYNKVLEYSSVKPLKGPKGVAYAPYSPASSKYSSYITRDCKYPEAAFRFLDYMCDTEISITTRRGKPGVDWKWTKEGGETHFSSIGIDAKYELVNNIWSENQNTIWTKAFGIQPATLFNAMLKKPSGNKLEDARNDLYYGGVNERFGMYPKEILANVIYTSEEISEINDIRTSLETYVDETRVRFVTGDLNIDKDWNEYIKTLDDIGLKKYLKVLQTAYTRMNKK